MSERDVSSRVGSLPGSLPSAGRRYGAAEELANCLSHGVGVGLSIAALSVLVTLAARLGDGWRVVSFSIYGATLILLYLASTLYHATRGRRVREVFRVLDHAAIFLLIAGTYTPFALVTLRGGWGWVLFGLVWGLAVAGITLKVLFLNRFEVLSVGLYLGMGWLVVVALKPLLAAVPPAGLIWLVAGGAAYTLGVLFFLWERLPFNHVIWHLFVLGGSVCHFFGILLHVLPA